MVKSCDMKSEDLSNMYTSDGDVHFSGDEEGRIQDASLDIVNASGRVCVKKDVLAFGEEKFSLGNTAPYSLITCRIWVSRSGKVN